LSTRPRSPPLQLPDARRRARLAKALLDWYGREKRDLPWRRTRDPYAVWVSEVMLQQTQVATVLPYYERWMQRFPTARALAEAAEDEVLHAWQGLGYYSRARRLLQGARAVVERHGGQLPDSAEALLALPGIGPYSAGAIASIAYGQAEPIVDGNVVRVLTRHFALRGDPARAPLKAELWALARALIPEGCASDFNQSLMELGATVCTPKQPRCDGCPVRGQCAAHAEGIVEQLPETARRPETTALHVVAALVWRRRRVLVTQLRDNAPRWAGMWQFPNAQRRTKETAEQALSRAVRDSVGLDAEATGLCAVVKHGVTRYRITLDAYTASAPRGRPRPLGCQALRWCAPDELEALAMPAAHRKIAGKLA